MITGYSNDLGRKMITIGPGEHHATRDDHVISTILGSCIAVALYDPAMAIGGLNHYMLPDSQLSPRIAETQSGRYGMYAMELLLGDLVKLGSTREHLRAKVFGGGTAMEISSFGQGVAERNARFAFEYLRSEGIPVEAADVGGKTARRVLFLPVTAKVLLRKIPWGDQDVTRIEQAYSRRLGETAEPGGQVTLF